MSNFDSAFASARKAGKKEFKWNGKSFNTKLSNGTPNKAPVPTARPEKAKIAAFGRDRLPSGPKARAAVPATGAPKAAPTAKKKSGTVYGSGAISTALKG